MNEGPRRKHIKLKNRKVQHITGFLFIKIIMVSTTMTIQDLIAYLTNRSGKKIDRDAILPYLILPVLLLIATISRLITLIVMVIIGMGALYVQSRPRQKNRSSFFFSWTMASGIIMFFVYNTYALHFYKITHLENLILLMLVACTCYSFYKVKAIADFELATGSSKGKEYSPVLTSDSHYCQICEIEVNDRFFHSIWWDCCILRPNYIYYLAGQIFALVTLLFGANLGLTASCQPYILYGPILMPLDCELVYYEFNVAMCFVVCVYGLGYVLVITLVLIRHFLVYIPKYCKSQWKKLFNVLNV